VTRKLTMLMATAAVAGGGLLAVTAQGQTGQAHKLVFTAGQPNKRDIKQIDVKPRGESLGDQVIGAITIRQAGKPIGRLINECSAADATYEGQMCEITLLTRAGQIIAQGAGEHRPLPGTGGDPGTGDVFAITGGTGAYAGASGTVTPRSTSHGESVTVVIDGP